MLPSRCTIPPSLGAGTVGLVDAGDGAGGVGSGGRGLGKGTGVGGTGVPPPPSSGGTSSPAGGDTKRSDFAKRRQSSEFIFDNLALGFCPWDKQDGAKEYVKNLDQNLVLRTWGVLYCGGAKKLEKDLRKVTDNYGLQIHVESFAW